MSGPLIKTGVPWPGASPGLPGGRRAATIARPMPATDTDPRVRPADRRQLRIFRAAGPEPTR